MTGSDQPYYVQIYGFPNSKYGSLGSTTTSKPTITVVSPTNLALSHDGRPIVDAKYTSWQLSHLDASLPPLFSTSIAAWNGISGTVDWKFNPKSSVLDPYLWEGETATFTVPVEVTAPQPRQNAASKPKASAERGRRSNRRAVTPPATVGSGNPASRKNSVAENFANMAMPCTPWSEVPISNHVPQRWSGRRPGHHLAVP